MPERRFVYSFTEGDGKNKMLLGGKGANLCEMTQIGLAVPPGFTITTEACLAFQAQGRLPDGLMTEVREHLQRVEQATGRGFGAAGNPLLVSVRSGSAMSMPGMMDTILNLGLNPATLQGLIAQTDSPRFGYDSYRRFVQLFGKVALGVPDAVFDQAMQACKKQAGAKNDVDLGTDALRELGETFRALVRAHTGVAFPTIPTSNSSRRSRRCSAPGWASGPSTIGANSRSRRRWPTARRRTSARWCSATWATTRRPGVGFTRNPATGENVAYGEYLVNAQGEDVVAGIRTPKPIAQMREEMPRLHAELLELRARLEAHYHEVQDFEFTIERGRLYCLQTRNGKMNARALVVTSVEMVAQGLINKEQALLRVAPGALEQLLVPQLPAGFNGKALAQGLAASPGAASGKVVFDADTAEARGKTGEKVILVREETKPEDIHGFFAAVGILTARGGKTSHAAVVARGMGRPCVSGCEAIHIDGAARTARVGDHVLAEGDVITIDGSTGNVYAGEVPTVAAELFGEFTTLLGWADEVARLHVHANADTPRDAARARRYGAKGIGLCRTERMFNDSDRLPIVQEMILAETSADRRAALDRLLPIQRGDFAGIFQAMDGLPVTVRLLDPPIHEFLPTAQQLEFEIAHLRSLQRAVRNMSDLPATLRLIDPELHKKYVDSIDALSHTLAEDQRRQRVESMLARKEAMLRKVHALFEVNPMLGHRGVRLGLTYPEIYEMQIRAILEAAAQCHAGGVKVHVGIMVPQVCAESELIAVRTMVDRVAADLEARGQRLPKFLFGSMIEVVRACVLARRLAKVAEFFSFGTNDLTQATFSFSREDAENKFLPMYQNSGLLRDNPFEVLDTEGVGELMRLAVAAGRQARPDLEVGICGEHGGHPDAIRFCHHLGLDYVSCSAPRVPVARLAAAQAKLREGQCRVKPLDA
jgi:pyruvate,orthophosphate dikinase